MNQDSRKRGKRIVLAVAVLVAAGAYFGISSWENDKAAKIEAYLNSQMDVTSATIKVGFFDKSVVITGFKGSGPYVAGATAAVSIGSLSLAGVNFDAMDVAGVAPLADSAVIADFMMSIDYPARSGTPAIKQDVTISSASLTKVRGDARLMEEMGRKTQNLNDPAVLSRYFAAAAGLHSETAVITGYGVRMDMGLPSPLVAKLESFQGKDFGLLACGPSTWTRISLNFLGQDMFTAASMSLERMSLPDIFTPIYASRALGDPVKEGEAVLQGFTDALAKEPFVMRGLVMNDVAITLPSAEPITLKSGRMDLELGGGKCVFNQNVEDLVLPPFAYRNLDAIGAMLGAAYGKPLRLRANAETVSEWKDGGLAVEGKKYSLSDPELGGITADFNLLFRAPGADSLMSLLQSAEPELLLKNAHVTFEDRSVLALTFKYFYEEAKRGAITVPDAQSPEALRAEAARQCRNEADEAANPDKKAILQGVVQLLERSGILTIDLNPDEPMPLDIFEAIDADLSGGYKIRTSYVPTP